MSYATLISISQYASAWSCLSSQKYKSHEADSELDYLCESIINNKFVTIDQETNRVTPIQTNMVETQMMLTKDETALVPYQESVVGTGQGTVSAVAPQPPASTELDEEKINPQELGQLIVNLQDEIKIIKI